MNRYIAIGILLFAPLITMASTECEIVDALKVVKEIVCEKSTGPVYHSNGAYAGSKGSNWYYSNGTYAGSNGSNWYHSTGQYAGSIGSNWYHQNGKYAGSNNSSWYYSNGQYAGSNGSIWYDSTGKYIGNFSDLSELEQLKMVLE